MSNALRITHAELVDLKARMAGADLSRLLYVASREQPSIASSSFDEGTPWER